MKTTLLLIFVAAISGCSPVQPPTPKALNLALPKREVSAVPAPSGHLVGFTFDPSPAPTAIGYKVYYGNATNSMAPLDIGNVTTFYLTNVAYPIHAYVTAYDADGNESVPSNLAGVLAELQQNVIYAQTNANLSGGSWADAFPVQTNINPVGQLFYRLRIEETNQIIKYP